MSGDDLEIRLLRRGDDLEIRPLQRGDGEALVACFRRCYGGTYVADHFNDAARAEAEIGSGRLQSVVAVVPAEGVVGHMGLTPREGALVAELGNTVVDPRYRGRDLTGRLTLALTRRCLELGLVGFVHYPTTAHPAMQKLATRGGGVELGVLLDYIPAETRYVGFDSGEAASRVAVVAAWHALAGIPARRVWLPDRHRQLALSLYRRLGMPREPCGAGEALPDAKSRLAVRFEQRRGLLRVEVEAAGVDLSQRVEAEVLRHPAGPVIVDLPLSLATVDAATESLAASGFFFGALLPEYVRGSDALRLQRVVADPVAPALETDGARRLFSYSLRDRVANSP